jgi:predicted DNA-binding transcriptional regulator AlpA
MKKREQDMTSTVENRARLPVYVRFADLQEAGVATSWQQLLRMIDGEDFPAGVRLSANTRAWRLDDVENWLKTRPTERKVMPASARRPLRQGAGR